MRVALKPHPDTPSTVVTAIEVRVLRAEPDWLGLSYIVWGDIGALKVARGGTDFARGDELWKHTCLEAFVLDAVSGRYREYNFSASRQLAAYAFEGYRRRSPEQIPLPSAEMSSRQSDWVLRAAVPVPEMANSQRSWRLALSAVIEEKDGAMSYWALAHPPGRPDFHHADGFVVDVPAWEKT